MSDHKDYPVLAFTDRRGVLVQVGDTVAYAVREHNIAVLKIAKVLSIYERESSNRRDNGPVIRVQAEGQKNISILRTPRRIVKLDG